MMKKASTKYKHLETIAEKITLTTGRKVTFEDVGTLFKNIVYSYTSKYVYYTTIIIRDKDLAVDNKIRKTLLTTILSLLERPYFSTKIYQSDSSLKSFIQMELKDSPLGIFKDFVIEAARDFLIYLATSAPLELLDIKEYRNWVVDVLKDYSLKAYFVSNNPVM